MDLPGDVRFTFRALLGNRGFTAAAIAILAVGIGVNAAVFAVINAVLFRGFPHVDPDNRIVYISRSGLSYRDFEDWRAQAKSFSGMAVVANGGLRLILSDESGAPETCDGTELSANAFQVLGRTPILGRDFTPSDAAPGTPAVAILNYGFWERRYEKNPSIIGKTVRLNSRPATLIGVMPPDFAFPHHRVDLWTPFVPPSDLLKRQNGVLWFAFGRLADGVTIGSAQAEMDIVGRREASSSLAGNRDIRPRLSTFQQFFIGPNASTFYLSIWGAVGFVLLIVCANLANLSLARALGRSREFCIRIALGAGRRRIVRQLLIESVILSCTGGAFGWLIAIGSVRAYGLLAHPPGSYDYWDVALGYRVFFYLVAVSVVTGLLFGLAPAIRMSRLELNAALKDGGRGTANGVNRRGLSALLVTAEMALAVVLLAGAGLMIRSFLTIYTADVGARTANILTASVDLPAAGYPRAEAQVAFFERLTTRLKSIPGIESLALADSLPGLYAPRLAYEVAGLPATDERHRTAVATVAIGPGYFRTLGAAMLSGRDFDTFDNGSGAPVAIVNQRFASKLWPAEEPIGKRIRVSGGSTPDAWRTVVGVASNIVQNDATAQIFDPAVYIPWRQKPTPFLAVLAWTRVPPRGLEPPIRREIQAIDPELVVGSGYGSIGGPRPLTDSLAFNYWSRGVNAALLSVLAAIALLLAAVGLYAVVAHSVTRRTREIGIRMAVGATAADVLRLVSVQAIPPFAAGLAIGLAGSLALTRVLKSELVQVSPADPAALILACGVLVLSALLGSLIPARRAMRVDPVVALRHE